eukprot:201719-Rhodomonas_salina.2
MSGTDVAYAEPAGPRREPVATPLLCYAAATPSPSTLLPCSAPPGTVIGDAATALRMRYAMSGTDIGLVLCICYAISETYVRLVLCICYAVSGTEIGYGATGEQQRGVTYGPSSGSGTMPSGVQY